MISRCKILCLFSVLILFVFPGVSSAADIEISVSGTLEETTAQLGDLYAAMTKSAGREKTRMRYFGTKQGEIVLPVRDSTVRGCCKDTWLVSVGNPRIADVELKKAGQRRYVLITAKAPGITNVVVCKQDATEVFTLEVLPPPPKPKPKPEIIHEIIVEVIRGTDLSSRIF